MFQPMFADPDWDSLVASQYPQLAGISYFDYRTSSPSPTIVVDRISSLGRQLFPSPHSSEEQSAFDRALWSLRTGIADLFSVSLLNYAVVIFGTAQSALDEIFEGFQWARGSHFIIDNSFQIGTTSSIQFAEKAGAVPATDESSSSAHSLLCISYSPTNVAKAVKFQSRCSGNHHILVDATQAAPFEFADLSRTSFDFVLLSMTKICGVELCPTLMRLEAAELLSPFFYGGGAVAFSCARSPTHRNFLSHSKRFENGTPPMLAIFSSLDGLRLMNEFRKRENVRERVANLIGRFTGAIEGRLNWALDEVQKTVFVDIEGAAQVRQALAEEGVLVGVEGDALAVSFGLPTSERDVDALVEALLRAKG
jgi:selenocysteine lyase/cysteine desulfurase